MIRLEKGEQPEVLADNAAEWTRVVVDKLAKNEVPTKTEKGRYNHPDIKDALVKETHGKCAYCESKLRHISYGDIEHVVPKSDSPDKWFSWTNLTLACDICNTNKSDAPIHGDVFIDPYEVDPELHFWQVGGMVQPKPGCDAAALTERLLKLNRAELIERRTNRLKNLMKMLDVIERSNHDTLKTILWEDFCREADSDKEYAALSREIRRLAGEKLGYQ